MVDKTWPDILMAFFDKQTTRDSWLKERDRATQDQLSRLEWLLAKIPDVDFNLYGSGTMAKYLFDNACGCYVVGEFLGTIVLGLSFVEYTLGGAFWMDDKEKFSEEGLAKLIERALDKGWISKDEATALDLARETRNSVTHFRNPFQEGRLERRAFNQNKVDYQLMEDDAEHVMETILKLLLKIVPWSASKLPSKA